MAVLYSKEKGKLGTLTGSIINWSNQLASSDPEDPTLYQTLPAGYLRCDGAVYQAEVFPELATCGYPPLDLIWEDGFIMENNLVLNEVASVSNSTISSTSFL